MSNRPAAEALSCEHLSALADGELDGATLLRACASWHTDAAQRATWHAYHLIGDVMRSDDLASDASRDAAFLGALRERLAAEPVVLAPSSMQTELPLLANAGRTGRWSWRASTAVAAGFVAVAGVVVVMRAPLAPADAQPAVMQAQIVPAVAPLQTVAVSQGAQAETAPEPQMLVANGRLIRDVQLDRYLAAHKQFAGSSALGVPSAFLSNATADASNR